jgi:hypothetical protein
MDDAIDVGHEVVPIKVFVVEGSVLVARFSVVMNWVDPADRISEKQVVKFETRLSFVLNAHSC